MDKPIHFQNSNGNTLSGILSKTKNNNRVLIMAHGFGSHKNTENFVKLSTMLAQNDIATMRFDFSGHGQSEGAFENITISQGVDDIVSAIAYAKELGYEHIGLLGSSFGGIASIMTTSKLADIAFLALKSPVSDFLEVEKKIHTEKQLSAWKNNGFILYNAGGKLQKLNYTFVEDFDHNNAYAAAKNITVPTLIVHGDSDNVVPILQSQTVVSGMTNAKLLTIKGADHRYSQPDHQNQMLDALALFVTQQMK